MNEQQKSFANWPLLARAGLSFGGVLGVVLGTNSGLQDNYLGSGVCIAASALAFGFILMDSRQSG